MSLDLKRLSTSVFWTILACIAVLATAGAWFGLGNSAALTTATNDATPRMVLRPHAGHDWQVTSAGRGLLASIDAGETQVGVDKSVAIAIGNSGNGPLAVTLERVSCGCVKAVNLGGRILPLRGTLPVQAGMENAELKIVWNADEQDLEPAGSVRPGRLVVTLTTSDPRHREVRLEIVTRLAASGGGATP